MKKIFKYPVTFIVLLLVFNLLLLLSSSFPSSLIKDNVIKSSKTLCLEGNSPSFPFAPSVHNNNYTDSIIINAAYSIDNQDPIFSYMSARKNFDRNLTTENLEDTKGELISITEGNNISDDYDPTTELALFLNDKITTSIEYARYWHGYLVILRVLLIFFDISQIRYLLVILFIVLFVTLIILARSKLGNFAALILCFALLVQNYFLVGFSLESSPVFIVTTLASILLLLRLDKIKNIGLYFFILGCITNFVDFLTVPLISLGIPLFIYLLHLQKTSNYTLKQLLKKIAFYSFLWLVAYGLTWISKWIIYDILYNRNLVFSGISQVFYRTTSSNYKTPLTMPEVLSDLLLNNLKFLIGFIVLTFMILFLFKIFLNKIYKIHFRFKPLKKYIKECIPYLLISLFPLIWYIVLSNHTVLHIHFVYRHMLVSLVGILICIKKTFYIEKINKENFIE